MSDNDRMDRAKRIREMREGQRDDERDGRAVEGVSGTTASLPSTEEMEAAMEQTMSQAETVDEAETDAGTGVESPATAATPEEAPGPAGLAEETTTQEAETRVLEFALAGERYCLDIEYIEEIVKEKTVTRVPNTPEFVDGVVDLRGQITTILNPKVAIGKDDQTPGDLIVVFDAEAFDDQGAIGWVVDDVRQVSPVAEDQVNDPPMGEDYINGVIDREDDDEFVIWTKPDLALDEAE
jgi:purine-binding chemotaxis protein CheW